MSEPERALAGVLRAACHVFPDRAVRGTECFCSHSEMCHHMSRLENCPGEIQPAIPV